MSQHSLSAYWQDVIEQFQETDAYVIEQPFIIEPHELQELVMTLLAACVYHLWSFKLWGSDMISSTFFFSFMYRYPIFLHICLAGHFVRLSLKAMRLLESIFQFTYCLRCDLHACFHNMQSMNGNLWLMTFRFFGLEVNVVSCIHPWGVKYF